MSLSPTKARSGPQPIHPVLRLNYYKPGSYDFSGGWGNEGSEIMMPVSPRRLLYVQAGRKAENRFVFSRTDTQLVQRLIVERAYRWVFARQPLDWVARMRPRVIDEAAFAAEQAAWREWPHEQLKSEM